MFVKADALLHGVAHQWSQTMEVTREINDERIEIVRRGSAGLTSGQYVFAELYRACRTPREDLARARSREAIGRAVGDAARRIEVTRSKLQHATTVPRPAHDVVGDTERIEYVEAEQYDVGRLEDVA